MTDRKEKLQALLAKVESGEVIQSTDAVDIWPMDAKTMALPWLDACKASQGSLDAALALHNAVLPGWWFSLDWMTASVTDSQDGQWFSEAIDGKPARAWLCAILQAMIAEDAA